MVTIQTFVFNPYQENTYLLYDDSLEAMIIDPGCSQPDEQEILMKFLDQKNLHLVKMVFTHGHFDHICGSKFIHDHFQILPLCHREEVGLVAQAPGHGAIFGFQTEPSPEPVETVAEGDSAQSCGPGPS